MNNKGLVDLSVFADYEILRLRHSSVNHICYLLECMLDYAKDEDIGEMSDMVTELKALINDFWLYDNERFSRGLKDGSK